ncbi:hypothetical protein SAMN04487831_106151 [Pseudobutyrivibrio sp. UC1225]|uniref:DUF6076 domain-containing protein n=1 Tax=Pseudobutyrivibrio sp. UC1225 TaxID=1798185 RepID=UPI0008E97F52|nr:DUF6076 domain-containing protein [Pseudobutyrivibrio sp. UC1225]SFO04034.1 hypothetical protein SAMN04487831_106151 [Pseudobutyrivibrio sp. UC1225]
MRQHGLIIDYENGNNHIVTNSINETYSVGELLCCIFQGEILYNIKNILRNCINKCPLNEFEVTQDTIEEAERFVIETLLYEDNYPARILAQGSIIRCIENYRSLDTISQTRILSQEIERAYYTTDLFTEIGFDTIGNFLRLCYNNYYIDLMNGIDLFRATAALWSNTATKEEQLLYEDLYSSINNDNIIPATFINTSYDTSTKTFKQKYIINSFLVMAIFEFSHIAESKSKIIRCENPSCRKFFVAKRTTAKYCNYLAPQSNNRCCNEYYPQLLHREKVRNDELERLIKNTKGRLYNAKRRHPENATNINNLINDVAIHGPNKKTEVLNGTLSVEQFKTWLNKHNPQEVLYE